MSRLATRFGNHFSVNSHVPLTEDQIRKVAPSIFAEDAHESRSDRYTCIPTARILDALRKEGFQPFMVAQTRVRDETRRDFAKHMVRLRHASQINASEANEIILVNSHDGSSAYQMLAGMLVFACANGMVCGDVQSDVRVPHKGNVVDNVVSGAFEVLDGFTRVVEEREVMKALTLDDRERTLFAKAAIELKHDTSIAPAPITEDAVLRPRRRADVGDDLWATLNRVQENLIRGGLSARTANGRRTTTRAVTGIDQDVRLNRALWMLADGLQRLRA